MALVDQERHVVVAVARRVEGPDAEASALDLLAVCELRLGEQRDAVARGELLDRDDVIRMAVGAKHVRDRDAVALRALLEGSGEPVAVDEDAAPARALGDEVGVREPVGVLDALDDHANSITLLIPSCASMSSNPRLLIAAHPTRGVDIGAQAAIWELLKDARAEGMGILLISADLDELIGLSDTLHVMLRGKLVATLDPAATNPEELGGHMTGARTSAGAA